MILLLMKVALQWRLEVKSYRLLFQSVDTVFRVVMALHFRRLDSRPNLNRALAYETEWEGNTRPFSKGMSGKA